jgi:hypothetical protein
MFERYALELEESLTPLVDNGVARLPFVGRSNAWAVLLREWERAEAGNCSTVLVEGDGGLGKTRLIEELAGRAGARQALWLSGKCYEIERAMPYALVSHVLRSAVRRGAVPESDPEIGLLGGQWDGDLQNRKEVLRYLESLAADHPVLLTCDDIHWADASSLRLLHFLTQQLGASTLLVVCTYRPAELSPEARRFAGSMAADGLARLITLTPLTVEDVADILTTLGSFTQPELGQALPAQLHRHTGGNPLFVGELLEALRRQGVLHLKAGHWSVDRDLTPESLPRTLGKLLADRVEALPEDLRLALEVMAALADSIEPDLLAEIVGVSTPRAELMIADLARRRLARTLPFGTHAVAHDELRQLTYAAIPDARRREIHRSIGTALEKLGTENRAGGPARLARHYEQAGDLERARRHVLNAAGEASAVGDAVARNGFLELAEAYAAGAAAGRRDAPQGEAPRHRRWPLYIAAAAVAAALLAIGTVWDRTGLGRTPPPWVQGTMLLSADSSTPDGVLHQRWYELRWPAAEDRAPEFVEVPQQPPGVAPPLLLRFASESEPHHAVMLRVTGSDTVPITLGPTDDVAARWSPDRRLIAIQRGWRQGDDYRYNIFVVDTLGSTVWQVTHDLTHDWLLDWSPDGSRLAFFRRESGRVSLWVTDVDGRRAEDLSASLDLPTDGEWYASFSPDGRRLAATRAGESEVRLIELGARLLESVPSHCPALSGGPVWSPDNRWLALVCSAADSRPALSVLAVDGTGRHHILSELPLANLHPRHWRGDTAPFVDRVQVRPSEIGVRTGFGLELSAVVTERSGRRTTTAIRWETLDTTIAVIDTTGFLRGRRAGRTFVVSSAGGFRADTAPVLVWEAPVDTLLHETWRDGIDTTRWHFVGSPRPLTVDRAAPDGGGAMLSNGDDRWPSGVLSTLEFDVTEGLTVEFVAQFQFTGHHWQELEAAIVPRSRALTPNNERLSAAPLAAWFVAGHSPYYATPVHVCRTAGASTGEEPWSLEEAHAGWHTFTHQIRPDGRTECYLDGRLLGVFDIPPNHRVKLAAIFLGGRTYRTRIYHGTVLVTRGLRY